MALLRAVGRHLRPLVAALPSRPGRLRRWAVMAVLGAMVALGTMSLGPAPPTAERQVPGDRRPPRAAVQSLDTTVVFELQQYVKTGSPSTWTILEGDEFTLAADTIPGGRFLIHLTNGTTGGQNRVSNVIVELNGRQFVGSSEVGTGIASLTRIAEVSPGTNGLTIWLKGASGSYIYLRVVRVNDPTFVVFGPTRYTKPPTLEHQVDSFVRNAGTAPYQLRLYNGGPDGASRVSNATVSINGTQVVSSADLGTGVATVTKTVTLADTNAIDVFNQSGSGTYLDSLRLRATDDTAPIVTWVAPDDSLVTTADKIAVTYQITDQTPGTARINGGLWQRFGGLTTTTVTDSVALPADGRYPLTITATNSAGLTTQATRTVWRDTQAPYLEVTSPANNLQTADSLITVTGSWADTSKTAVTVDDEVVAVGFADSLSKSGYALDVGPNRITICATDGVGHRTEVTRFVFRTTVGEPVAPDSNVAASALDPTAISSFIEQVRFLYAGPSPSQIGADTTAFSQERICVVSGQVTSRDYGGLPNVAVRILGHPEYGHTLTRKDGRFDLAVNGGGQLVVRFNKAGFLEGQRLIEPGYNEYVFVDSTALIGRSAYKTPVDFAAATMVRSRFRTDANGDRDLRIFFPARTVARVVRTSGDTVSFSRATVRATEYTVGREGASAMPGVLPPSSAYTYCVDLRLDESDSLWIAGAPEPAVLFNQGVSTYVRNFLHFPVGTAIPAGSYDSWSGRWNASPDGVVLRVLSVAGGQATVDSDGDGAADGQPRLAALGITTPELQALAQQYVANDTLWRVVVDHFSPLDDNVNMLEVNAQQSPTAARGGQPMTLVEDPTQCQGCVIEVENRVLGEEIPIVGTPYALHYRSFRAPGDVAMRTLRIQVSGDTVPSMTERILVRLDVAGRRLTQDFTGTAQQLANRVAVIPWDGLDRFGRRVQGSVNARVSVGYQYKTVMGKGGRGGGAASSAPALGDPAQTNGSLGSATGDRAVGRVSWVRRWVSLGAPSAASAGLGGWTLTPHHVYDVTGRGALYYGDGTIDLGERNYPVITAHITNLWSQDVAIASDGAFYVAAEKAILKYSRTGAYLGAVAGDGVAGAYTDGALGTQTHVTNPRQLAVGPDGSVYFVMSTEIACNCQRVVRLGTDGIVRSIAGDGIRHAGSIGDGGKADTAGFAVPYSIAIGPDGSIFVGDREAYVVRRIAPNGYINVYAGTGSHGTSDSTGKATLIRIGTPYGLAVDATGNLFIAEAPEKRIRKVAPDGTMTTVVTFAESYRWPHDVVSAADGAIYFGTGTGNDNTVNRVFRIDPDGTLAQIAGGGPDSARFKLDGVPAMGSSFGLPSGIAVAANGDVYFSEYGGGIKRVAPALPGQSLAEFTVPSRDGAQLHFFNLQGRHLRTRDAVDRRCPPPVLV